jgi:dinuclear metal center YbgI/SA1388 family protein
VPTVAEVCRLLDGWFDPAQAESWDAVGLVCGDPEVQVRRMLLAVDAVPATVDEAIMSGAQLLLTHHPLLLTGVHGVPASDPKGALVHRMIRTEVAHFVAHTNADVAAPGVSDALAARLGVHDARPLLPGADPDGRTGTGRIGALDRPCTLREFTAHAARALPATVWGVRAAGDPDKAVRIVAVCGGSGGSYAAAARAAGADVLLTADLKHHPVVEEVTERGPGGLALVDAAHWATEAPWLDDVAARLRDRFGTSVDVNVSTQVTDPWTLHTPSPGKAPVQPVEATP